MGATTVYVHYFSNGFDEDDLKLLDEAMLRALDMGAHLCWRLEMYFDVDTVWPFRLLLCLDPSLAAFDNRSII